ncbi:mersacidin family lantibiotic [Paenibacillus xerothermodurans]|uniref:Type 2 lantibiotic n=1 Tax=Paenibacillus xerothermodurans TaxID=1977292 RepID=A0A2W1NM62_PAEXE|nr:mersacidin family lantibiotic [Paenibacillus xerothermodurans]PZE20043.1 type 2 lantibiotic [Paenibacillus xerothermodurans]
MTRAQALERLKDNDPSGAKLVEVSLDELTRTRGGGDVKPEWTPTIFVSAFSFGYMISLTLKR